MEVESHLDASLHYQLDGDVLIIRYHKGMISSLGYTEDVVTTPANAREGMVHMRKFLKMVRKFEAPCEDCSEHDLLITESIKMKTGTALSKMDFAAGDKMTLAWTYKESTGVLTSKAHVAWEIPFAIYLASLALEDKFLAMVE